MSSNISTPYYRALDFTLIFVCCSIAYWLRFDTFSLPLYYFLPTTVLAVTSMLSLGITNFYQNRNSEFSTQQVLAAFNGLVISTMITIVCLYLTKTGEDYSRVWLITSIGIALTAILLVRFFLEKGFHLSAQAKTIILLGDGRTAQTIVNNIAPLSKHEISIAKQLSDFTSRTSKPQNRFEQIAVYIEARRIDPTSKYPISEIWVTHDIYSQYPMDKLETIFNNSSASLVYIPEIPSGLELTDDKVIQYSAGVPTINLGRSRNHKIHHLLKFLEDQIIAWLALFSLSPLILAICICIKLDSPGPVLFKQTRYGLSGKSFSIWKFRTMQATRTEQVFKQAEIDDVRVTKIGKFLRRSSLDELPQLFNVITGTMSIVGPRPHPEALNEQHRGSINQYMQRHTSKPGITGLAQVNGFRGETTDPALMVKRVKYDLEYIKKWSLFLDFKILLLTLIHVFRAKNAY